jgi:hypothetical protein
MFTKYAKCFVYALENRPFYANLTKKLICSLICKRSEVFIKILLLYFPEVKKVVSKAMQKKNISGFSCFTSFETILFSNSNLNQK